MSETRDYTADEWQQMKDTIRKLYILDNQSFKEMRESIAARNFFPTKNKLLNMLKQWGFQKYSKAERWRALPDELKRKGIDLEHCEQTEVEVDGRTISTKKLKKELQRHGAQSCSDVDRTVVESSSMKQSARSRNLNSPIVSTTNTTSHVQVRAADVSKFLQLPMFDLLRTISFTFDQDTHREQSAEDLILFYRHVRIYLLDTITQHGKISFWISKNQAAERIIIDALECARKSMHDGDRVRFVEAILPDIRIEDQPHPLQSGRLRCNEFELIAPIYFVSYLWINCMAGDNILDILLKWSSTTPLVRQALHKVALLSSPISRHLRNELLHAAIRCRDRMWAVQLLDTHNPQFTYSEVKKPGNISVTRMVSQLQAAILVEDIEMVQSFITAGLDIDAELPSNIHGSGRDDVLQDSPLELALQNQKMMCLWPSLIRGYDESEGLGIVACAVLSGAPWNLIVPLINYGADIHESYITEMEQDWRVEDFELSAVHAACISGNTDVLESLLRLGLNVNGLLRKHDPQHIDLNCVGSCCLRKLKGQTPLILAIRNGHISAARVLLEFGADTNEQEPLAVAIALKAYEMASILLEHGAIPSWPKNRWIWRDNARGAPKLLQDLFEYGLATVPRSDSSSWEELLECFAGCGTIDSMVYLLAVFEEQCTTTRGQGACLPLEVFNNAVRYDNLDVVKYLADHKCLADVLVSRETRMQILESASRNGAIAVFEYAIQQYASCFIDDAIVDDVGKKKRVKDCLLTIAAANGRVASVVALLEDGASPCGDLLVNDWVQSPVHSAFASAKEDVGVELLRSLYNYGMDPEEIRKAFWSALEDESLCISSKVTDFLLLTGILEAKHVIEEVLSQLRSLSDYHYDFSYQYDINSSLIECYVRMSIPVEDLDQISVLMLLGLALSSRRFDLAEVLMRASIAVTDQDTILLGLYGNALSAACAERHVIFVKRLLDKGVDPNLAEGSEWETALQSAAGDGSLSIVQLLLQAGADISGVSEDEAKVPIFVAAWYGRLDVVMLLLAHCSDLKTSQDMYHAAREAAVEKHRTVIVETLDEYAKSWTPQLWAEEDIVDL